MQRVEGLTCGLSQLQTPHGSGERVSSLVSHLSGLDYRVLLTVVNWARSLKGVVHVFSLLCFHTGR